MDILLITEDKLLRDRIKVGLQQFPEFRVTVGEGFPGVNLLHTQRFDYVFMELGGGPNEAMTLLAHLRSFDHETEVVAVADAKLVKDLGREKQRYRIASFLNAEVDVNDFFRLVARLRARRSEAMEPSH